MTTNENPVIDTIIRAHAKLLGDLRVLTQIVRPFSREGLDALRSRLRTVRRDIAQHFNLEEQNGFMDAVKKREPRLDHTVDQLAEEHRQLRRSLDSLIVEAKLAARVTERIRTATRKWIQSVRHHESRENKLIQAAFAEDIAAED